jgi:hypothetical protein
MKLTDKELAIAKRYLARRKVEMINQERMRDPNLSDDDRALMRRYPKHTLEAARLINATPRTVAVPRIEHHMHECGEDFLAIQRQERGFAQ